MPMLQPDPALADEAARLADTFAARLAGATEDLAPPEALLAYAAAARRWAENPNIAWTPPWLTWPLERVLRGPRHSSTAG